MKKENLLTNKLVVAILAIFSSVLWGSAFPVLKISYEQLEIPAEDVWSKVLFAGIRFFGAGIIIFLLIFFLKMKQKLEKKDFLMLFFLGILQTTLQYFFFYIGVANTSGIKSAILISANTFLVVIFSHFIYHNDKMNMKKIIGLSTGLLGIIFVNWGQGFNFSFTLFGEGFLIFSGIVSAIGTILAKKMSSSLNPFFVTAWQMVLGAGIMIIIGGLKVEQALKFNFISTTLLIYSMFLSGIAFSIWYVLLRYNKAGEISIYRFFIPVSGTILSSIFLPDEYFTFNILIALCFVMIEIYTINKKEKKIKI
jgi:drug/metabolite transporter (DMT)-like permease